MISYTKSQKYFINTTTGAPSVATMHYHNTYDIYYAEAGKREYFVEDKVFTASTGDFVLIKPSSFHRIGEGNVLRTLISFTDDFLETTFSPAAVKKLIKCFERSLICPPDQKQADFKELLKTLSKCTDATIFALNLGVLLLKLSSITSDSFYEDRTSAIIKYINQNFAEIHSLEQIANHMYISKQHLCRLFKNSMGITLIDYLNKIKVKNACAFLENTSKSLTEICHLCGFKSSAYFSTVFKDNTGLSPLKYRKLHKKG